jgi:hypothetical protein
MANGRGPARDLLAVDAYIAALRRDAGWVRNGGADPRPLSRRPEPATPQGEASAADPDLTCATA